MHKIVNIFLPIIFFTFVLGAQKNRLIEMVLLSTHIMFWLKNEKIIDHILLSNSLHMYLLYVCVWGEILRFDYLSVVSAI